MKKYKKDAAYMNRCREGWLVYTWNPVCKMYSPNIVSFNYQTARSIVAKYKRAWSVRSQLYVFPA